jgi:hypothetical protein
MLIRFIANLALSLAFSISLSAQVSKPETKADLGSLTFSRTHLRWPTPDSLVKDLRADDDQTRLQALALIGASPSGDMPGTPLEVELRYASLGSDAQQQAIVGVDLGPMLFGAVAVHENGVWHRIANFSCWCKYEFGDLVGDFIHVESGPENGLELVLRASGGGTGVYSQDEAHFRYYRGELHLVLSFVSHFRACDPTAPGPYTCQVERRWFYANNWDSVPGGVLVESRFSFSPNSEPEAQLHVRDLELSYAKTFSCKTYKWNKEKFLYTEFSAPNPCKPRPSMR